jgi:hypothetical protein
MIRQTHDDFPCLLLVAGCTERILKTAYRTPANFIDSGPFRSAVRARGGCPVLVAAIWFPGPAGFAEIRRNRIEKLLLERFRAKWTPVRVKKTRQTRI